MIHANSLKEKNAIGYKKLWRQVPFVLAFTLVAYSGLKYNLGKFATVIAWIFVAYCGYIAVISVVRLIILLLDILGYFLSSEEERTIAHEVDPVSASLYMISHDLVRVVLFTLLHALPGIWIFLLLRGGTIW